MDIRSLQQLRITNFLREVRFGSHSSGRDSISSNPQRVRHVNLERSEKGEEDECVVWLPGAVSGTRDMIGQFNI
jgi:hypothetical protein